MPGQTSTGTLPGGARVSLLVEGPELLAAEPRGATLSTAVVLHEVFTLTWRHEDGPPVEVGPPDVALRTHQEGRRPAVTLPVAEGQAPRLEPTTLQPGTSVRGTLVIDAAPGSGSLTWQPAGRRLATWSFAAETH